LVDNPRSGETLVEDFSVDTSTTRTQFGWQPEHTVAESIRTLLRTNAGVAPSGDHVEPSL
jgi:UDP-glucose 4-epimerase